jgi:hypothetical protein
LFLRIQRKNAGFFGFFQSVFLRQVGGALLLRSRRQTDSTRKTDPVVSQQPVMEVSHIVIMFRIIFPSALLPMRFCL